MYSNQVSGLLSPWLRRQRFKAALPYIKGRILDVGCDDGALAGKFKGISYTGIDINKSSIETASGLFPEHTFNHSLSECRPPQAGYDTIVMLAVLEHLSHPTDFLTRLTKKMQPQGRLVVTTPAPGYEFILTLGSRLGLFSSEAQAEHQTLIGYQELLELGIKAGLQIVKYERFLAGANQLVIYRHRSGS